MEHFQHEYDHTRRSLYHQLSTCTLELIAVVSMHGILLMHFGTGVALAAGALGAYGVISVRHIAHLRRIIAKLNQD